MSANERYEYAGLTDVGMKRTHNEDNYKMLPEFDVYLVADGMGGHASGEVASEIAVETVAGFFADSEADEDITWPYKEDRERSFVENRFITSFRYANLQVFSHAQEDVKKKGMGTTIVGIAFKDSKYYVAHVGDSRCYRIRNGQIEQLTEDHSLLNDYKKMAKLTAEEEKNFPHKNIIVRALGMKDTVLVDLGLDSVIKDDLFILCSDGLSGELEDDEILSLAMDNLDDLDSMCSVLINAANANGGKDNVTAVVVRAR
ncbi:MAG TPA: Stp1/IreP family PP2C-type Ser/Thr phosphatase [Myxococcales bacterium]|nr:Stp1/IreP family PP2C-type Ser/Thr phosphatase [Myxococcales bacterium]